MPLRTILIFTLMFVFASTSTHHFEIGKKSDLCLHDEYPQGTILTGYYEVQDPQVLLIDFVVRDQFGLILQRNDGLQTAKFAFSTEHEGKYLFCFTTNRPQPNLDLDQKLRISFQIKKNQHEIDESKMSTIKDLYPLEKEIKKLGMTVNEIHEDIYYTKRREARMRDTNESTNSRVMWLSIISIFTMLIVSSVQIIYLKTFFKKRKLI
ncbi:transmembrane emp24 domain-containing protein [Anaeramoeba flamelloides]|uniref:Transmembrane emp24 domain-containing protein n=1 Tax=Anaeramoeba flamelloides TaxID=1746091 RepID=A0AAV7ZWA2_9EUKA|nr:transmembrane emp24 domain-containing protein [Anaeramoeba flamelloides]